MIDDDTGDFTTLDPTKCPQCNESGAFRNEELPPLSEDVMATEEEEARRRREGVAAAMLSRALSRLNDKPMVRDINTAAETREIRVEEEGGIVYRRINGDESVVAGLDGLDFQAMASVGIPNLFCRSGVLYFEAIVSNPKMLCDAQIGFSLADGIEDVMVGHDNKSWGLDLFNRGIKSCDGASFGSKVKPNWTRNDIIGVAVNIEKGMIAVSTDGSWELTDGNGVKFEDEKIQAGVYPVVSASDCRLSWRFLSNDLHYGPPPESVWGIWPKFEDIHWIKLPVEARAAALKLGYTQTSWCEDEGNPIEQKKWNDLSSEEQSAANVLGYNELIWTHITTAENDDEDSVSSYDGVDDSDDEDDSENDRIETFNELRWESLPSDAKRAAEILNFTQTMWNEDAVNPLLEKEWEELTDEQQRAAIILGYDENAWGDCSWMNCSSDISNSSHELPFDHMSWADLPRDVKEAAVKLGYTEQLWNEDEAGPLEDTKFIDLTEEQQFACAILGYSNASWDFAVNKRLFNQMDMSDAFEAMQTISVIMSNFGER